MNLENMTAIDPYQIDTDNTDTWLDYTASEYCDILDNFFTFEDHPQILFYDIPQGALLVEVPIKKCK